MITYEAIENIAFTILSLLLSGKKEEKAEEPKGLKISSSCYDGVARPVNVNRKSNLTGNYKEL
jgi:hypothetical protein